VSRATPAERARLASAIDGVKGWLALSEAWALHEAARRVGTSGGAIVEVGSYHGRSTIALALGARAGGADQVFAVDPESYEEGQYEAFLGNIGRAGVQDNVRLIRALSHDARPEFEDQSIDLLFLDGAHQYHHVLNDVKDWQTALRDGAVIAFNDAFWLEGVRRALQDSVARRRFPFRRPRWIFNTMFFDYSPSKPWTLVDTVRLARARAFLRIGGAWTRFHGRLMKDRIPKWIKDADHQLMLGTLRLILPAER